ncbi:hypothetical protein SCANM63S_09985 [Streptomyces canarius]
MLPCLASTGWPPMPEVDADQLLVLLGPALPGRRLLERLERGRHPGTALGRALRHSVRGGLMAGDLSVARGHGRGLSDRRGGGLLTVSGGIGAPGWPPYDGCCGGWP